MKIWIDAHLSPAIAIWIRNTFEIEALALRDLELRDAEDIEIFEFAKAQKAILQRLPVGWASTTTSQNS
jgi:predicted nuclease of predicted toxin-antitoxin system